MSQPIVARPFAYNPSPNPIISGTIQIGDLAVGTPTSGLTNNPLFWNGPNEDLGYVIAYPVPAGDHPTPIFGVFSSVGFLGTKNMPNPLNESTFVELTNNSFNQSFTNGNDASTWLTNNGYWNSWVSTTPTPTATLGLTPTPTPSVTTTITPTLTPTPSTTPSNVTGYSFNLVVLPYNYPSSGSTIMVDQAVPGIGTTNPNVFAINLNGIYFNTFDSNGTNRNNYFASFTGQSITITLSQSGNTAIYSGDSNAFQSWSSGADSGFTFGYGIAQPGYSAGTTVLIQSASTPFITGQTVTISAVVNGAGVTPTPTATSVTPTPTPTSGSSGPGWFFYSPNNSPVASPPSSNGNTAFITNSGIGLYNPNYTGGTFNLYFNNNNSVGTSYAAQFTTLDTAGGTITLSQGSSTVIYSGTASEYINTGTFTYLNVTRPEQMVQSAATPFVSGTSINLVVS